MEIDLILLLAAAVLIGLEAFGITAKRVRLGWLGLLAFVLSFLL